MTINKKVRYFKFITEAAGVVSIALAAVSLLLTNNAVRTSYTIDSDKTSQQLLLNWYDLKSKLKEKQAEISIGDPMETELAAWKTLFIAESIFLSMKTSSRPERWLDTVDFLIKDATGLKMDETVLSTFNPEFADRVKEVFASGKNNKGEVTKKFVTNAKTTTP